MTRSQEHEILKSMLTANQDMTNKEIQIVKHMYLIYIPIHIKSVNFSKGIEKKDFENAFKKCKLNTDYINKIYLSDFGAYKIGGTMEQLTILLDELRSKYAINIISTAVGGQIIW